MKLIHQSCPFRSEPGQCSEMLGAYAMSYACQIARCKGYGKTIAEDVGQEGWIRLEENRAFYGYCRMPEDGRKRLIYTMIKNLFSEEFRKSNGWKRTSGQSTLVFPKSHIDERYAQENMCADHLEEEAVRDTLTMFCEILHEHGRQVPVDVPIDLSAIEESEGVSLIIEGLTIATSHEAFEVFMLRLRGVKHKEIARFLGISETKSRSLLFNARKALRERREKGGSVL